MGNFQMDIPDDLLDFLKKAESQIDEIAEEAVRSAEDVVVDALKSECSKHNIAETDQTRGQMMQSIKATGPRKNQYGIYDYVRPTGKDTKGVRNMEKLAYLEYGTSKQAATPVCQKVVNQIGEKISNIMSEKVKEGLGI